MKRFAMLIGVIGLLLLPAAASANSTCQQYSSQSCSAASLTQTFPSNTSPSSGATRGTVASRGTLPFTGLDVVLLAAGAGTLLVAGVVMRRVSRGVERL